MERHYFVLGFYKSVRKAQISYHRKKLKHTILLSEGYMGKFVKSNRNHADDNIISYFIKVFDAELVSANLLPQAFR